MFCFVLLIYSFGWIKPQNQSYHCILPGTVVMATLKQAIASVLNFHQIMTVMTDMKREFVVSKNPKFMIALRLDSFG